MVNADRVSVAAVDRVIHVLGWYMPLLRPSMSIFEVSHRWLNDHRGEKTEMPEGVRRELLTAVAVAPLIVAHFDFDLNLSPQAVDASNLGGAVAEKAVTPPNWLRSCTSPRCVARGRERPNGLLRMWRKP